MSDTAFTIQNGGAIVATVAVHAPDACKRLGWESVGAVFEHLSRLDDEAGDDFEPDNSQMKAINSFVEQAKHDADFIREHPEPDNIDPNDTFLVRRKAEFEAAARENKTRWDVKRTLPRVSRHARTSTPEFLTMDQVFGLHKEWLTSGEPCCGLKKLSDVYWMLPF
jgi:hypothetical protein